MSETQKKPKLTKLERRAQALRDNLKKRKQQQVKRNKIKSLEIPLQSPLNSKLLVPNEEKIDNQNHVTRNQLETIDVKVVIELPPEKKANSHKIQEDSKTDK